MTPDVSTATPIVLRLAETPGGIRAEAVARPASSGKVTRLGRRTIIALLVCALLAPLLASPPPAAAAPAPEASVVHAPGLAQAPDNGEDGPLVDVTTVDEADVPAPLPAEPVSEEIGRPGWTPEVAAAVVSNGRNPVGRTRVAGPVSVEVKESNGRGTERRSARANVLPPGLARQLSAFGAAVSLDFVDNNGAPGRMNDPFELTFDLRDVALSTAGDGLSRLTVTRFVGCDLFEPETDDPEGAERLGPEVLCEGQERLDDVRFERQGRTLTVVVDEVGSDARIERVRGVSDDPGAPGRANRQRVSDADVRGALDPDGGAARRGQGKPEDTPGGGQDTPGGGQGKPEDTPGGGQGKPDNAAVRSIRPT